MTIQAIKGVKDILPEDIPAWQHLEATARKTLRRLRFCRDPRPGVRIYRAFCAQHRRVDGHCGKGNVYLRGPRRQENHAPARGYRRRGAAFIEHKMYADTQLTKLYYLGPMFRHERPQKGRYRQFHQIGVEALGIDHPHVDIEVLAMLHALYEALGIKGLTLQINSLGDSACRGAYRDSAQELSQGQAADPLRGLPAAVRDQPAPRARLQGGC